MAVKLMNAEEAWLLKQKLVSQLPAGEQVTACHEFVVVRGGMRLEKLVDMLSDVAIQSGGGTMFLESLEVGGNRGVLAVGKRADLDNMLSGLSKKAEVSI
ncbi:hypothetical protein HYV64_03155 [Candidatus Shapirobacteria bacterium]|nr:hypothetical protein [Candidatus Shapirobacteria bacterium]